MQWADTTSWDALEHLLSQLDSDRLMICLTHRPDSTLDSAEHQQMLKRDVFARELTLSRLTRDEVKQWLEAAFHRQQVGREFLAFLYRHTEGNPLFITQLLRALVEDGAIWYSGNRWEWTPVSELRLPGGRAALIAQRLSKFSSSTQAVLGTAAIAGRQFDVRLLVGAGAGSEPAVRLAISEAALAGLLRPTDERRQGGFAFAHDEIAEVLVESIPRERVRQLHQRVAQSLATQHPERVGEIAFHFDAAGEASDAYRWAQLAAKVCAMRALAILQRSLGTLDKVRAILKVTVYVQSADGFTQQSEVADAASELIVAILGPAGAHARTSVGVFQLPKNATVEVDLVASVE